MEPLFESRIPRDRLLFGFRRGKSTQDALCLFTCKIYREIALKRFVIVVFVDIRSAYDHVDLDILCNDLSEMGVPDKLVKLTAMINRTRRLYTQSEEPGGMLGPWTPHAGVGQGSKLAPLLFNIYTSKLSEHLPEGILMGQYVDDLFLLGSGESLDSVVDKMNSALEAVHGSLQGRQLPVAENKTCAIVFGKRRLPPTLPTLQLAGFGIPWVRKCKYLGVTFDSRMLWRKHVNNTCRKALQGINIMKAICRTWWGSHPTTLLTLYRALVRPHLDYGSSLIDKCSRALLARLD